jgi:branched-chain amino acid transport system ATP-binding protein
MAPPAFQGHEIMSLLETRDLTKHFGGLVALNKVSIHIDEGEILGLIGPNGAGKTTFLNAVAGLERPDSGAVFFMGKNCTGVPPEVMCHKGLARTFQIPQPFPKMSVLENVMVATLFGNRDLKGIEAVRHSRDQLKFVEFPLSENTLSETLNTVELKRLDLARALASKPKLLLLDEVASGLTELELADLILLIQKIRERGVSIIMVEHILKMIMRLSNRLVVLQFGNVIADGATIEVAQDEKVREAYLGTEVKNSDGTENPISLASEIA